MARSPFTKRGIVDSTMYTQPSMVKTIELMLGLPSMSIFDLVATDMRASFIAPGESPNLAPYVAVSPQISLLDENPRPASIQGRFVRERRSAALASARMNLDSPDEAPSEQLNRILWHDARGWDQAYPTVKHAMVFPYSVDVADEDRRGKAAASEEIGLDRSYRGGNRTGKYGAVPARARSPSTPGRRADRAERTY